MQPDFALPYAGLSSCYCLLGSMGQQSPEEAFAKAKSMANKALELDNKLSEAYSSLAWVGFWFDLDWETARINFEKALTINPDSADSHQGYAMYKLILGKFQEAIDELKLATELDPLSLSINNSLTLALMCAEEYEEALAQANKTLEMDPTFRSGIEAKGYLHALMGNLDKSIENFQKYRKMTDNPLAGVTGLGYAYALVGDREKAEECLQILKQREKVSPDLTLYADFLTIYTGLEDFDKVFYYLEKSIEAKVGIFFFKSHPVFKNIRKDARFGKLMLKIGLGD
jgi:tetratricopeptide (TPR) repeat protein